MDTVLVVGAGIIGSAVALELHRRGARVTVLESASEGGQTSVASAGMVNPFSLTPEENPALPFAIESRRQFPEWVASLKALTGIDAEWRAEGGLCVALTPGDRAHLQRMLAWVVRYEPSARLLSDQEVRQLEPALTEQCLGGLWLPSEGWVHTERLMRALHQALRQSGVALERGRPAIGFATEGRRVVGVRTATGTLYADAVVLCAGAWASMLADTLGISIPIEPLRGQVLVLRDLPQGVGRLLVSPIGYLVPQADGSALFGATRERVGYDTRVTAEGVETLLSRFLQLFPRMVDATLMGFKVGLRPNTPDHQPLISALPHWDGLYLACGHSYHGILLAPATAAAVADLVRHGATSLPIEPFKPERFEKHEVNR